MPIIFPVLVPLAVILAAFAVLALHLTANLWLRPMLDGLANPRGSFIKRVAMAPVISLLKGVLWIEKHVRTLLSHAAAASLPVATRWLSAHAHRVAAQAREQAAAAVATAEALGVLRHRTMPRAITAKVAPVKAVATHAGALAGQASARVKAEEKGRRRSISLTTQRLGALAAGLLGIDVLVKGRHAAHHHSDHAHDLPQIRDRDIPHGKAVDRAHGKSIADHGARIKRIERALGLGVIGALMYRVLARVAPWLFCRNWKKIGRAVCGLSPGRVDALLGLLLGALALSDLRSLASFAASVEDEAVRGLGELLHLPKFRTTTFTED